ELWERCPAATPFQTPDWLIPWWKHLGESELLVLAVREEGRLVGLAPFFLYTKPGSRVRELFLLGTGTTDYLDALFLPGWAEAGAEAVFARLDAMSHRWDLCDLQQLSDESPLLGAVPEGWIEEVGPAEACPVLALDAHLSRVPGKMLHNLRYYRRRAERCGRVEIEAARPENLDALFAALLRLHAARWSERGEGGVLADPRVQRHHRGAAPELLRRGVLQLFALRIDGEIVACYYGLLARGRAYYYLSGFDPAWSHLSPGTLVIGHALEEAVRGGARELDFLRGREPYKYFWGAEDHFPARRRLWHPVSRD
ncbi:MAG TPA: GNAT family N-acetyltransferase, partial [Armatimonadota bacterium]|nr:GNAT family N-acetyltransferase [Armatimonadota bacterium]